MRYENYFFSTQFMNNPLPSTTENPKTALPQNQKSKYNQNQNLAIFKENVQLKYNLVNIEFLINHYFTDK